MHDLQKRVQEFNETRAWLAHHNRQSLVLAMCEELGELAKLVAWGETPDVDAVGMEVADLLIYALSFSNCVGIDAEAAVNRKLAINAARFPV